MHNNIDRCILRKHNYTINIMADINSQVDLQYVYKQQIARLTIIVI